MSLHAQQLSRAANWLLHSGIQSSNGGVARFYRSDQGQNAPVSTEITGYYAGSMAWLHQATGRHDLLTVATKTADFLVDTAWDNDLQTFPFEWPHAAPTYFFDCGIIVRGLLSVWRLTRIDRYRDVAESCAAQMAVDFDAEGFDFHPVLNLPAKTPTVRDPQWSRSSGCYQLKAALAFHEAAQPKAWERLLKQSLQQHDQFLPGHTNPERVMDRLHAYCYFLEALLATKTNHSHSNCARAVALGVQRVAYLLHRIEPLFARSDVYAQLLRVRLYADAAGILPLDSHTAALEAEQLMTFQLTSRDSRVEGGFSFGRKGDCLLPYVNPVSTLFAAQALQLWHLSQNGAPLPPVEELV